MMEEEVNALKNTRFPKSEKLKSKKLMDALFSKGASFHLYPFFIRFLQNPNEEDGCHQMLVSVSKKKFKRAVDRNLIKRRVREAYRLHKWEYLYADGQRKSFLIAYIYTAKEIHPYSFIEAKLIDSFRRLKPKTLDTGTQPENKL